MKKILVACGIITALAFVSNSAHAQVGVKKGTTKETKNSSGGVSRSCDPSENICTTNTQNSDGTRTVVVYQYDSSGNLTGTVILHTRSGPRAHMEDIPGGYIHDVETTEGILFGKAAR